MANALGGATILYANISLSASGDLVTAMTGKSIKVVSLVAVTTTAVTVKFQSGGSTDITGAMPMGATGVLVLPHNPSGWFKTNSGEKLNLVLGSGVATGGVLAYVLV